MNGHRSRHIRKPISSHLGLIHPIPIFGEHAYFFPPSMLHVDDKQADDVTFDIVSKSKNKNLKRDQKFSNEREVAEKLRKYIPSRIKRCWKVVKGRSGDNIDPEKYCASLFKGMNHTVLLLEFNICVCKNIFRQKRQK